MKKNRWIYILICLIILVGFAAGMRILKTKKETELPQIDSLYMDYVLSNIPEDKRDSVIKQMEEPDNYKVVDEEVIPYIIDEMCGYRPDNLEIGVITVRKDIKQSVLKKAFPRLDLKQEQVDSIGDIFINIKPMRCFPQGEYGRILSMVANDSIIQVQFEVAEAQQMMDSMTERLSNVAKEIEELAKEMENIQKNK